MAQVVVELSGDDAKLFRSYQRIIEQARKLDEGTKRNKRSSDEAFGSLLPITMKIWQLGCIAPEIHHLRPLST